MSATHGSARRLRSRSRLLGCALVALIALSAVMASSAGATPPIKETYMALGDSLAFGYSQQLFNEHIGTGEPASAFEHGYATTTWCSCIRQRHPVSSCRTSAARVRPAAR